MTFTYISINNMYVIFLLILADASQKDLVLEAKKFYPVAVEFLDKAKLLQEAPEELKRKFAELQRQAALCAAEKSNP